MFTDAKNGKTGTHVTIRFVVWFGIEKKSIRFCVFVWRDAMYRRGNGRGLKTARLFSFFGVHLAAGTNAIIITYRRTVTLGFFLGLNLFINACRHYILPPVIALDALN